MSPGSSSRIFRAALVLVGAFTVALIATTIGTGRAAVAATDLPETPRSDTPVATDGRAYGGAQAGDRIIVGGSFSQVEPQPGQQTISLPNLFIYDVNTGLLDPNQFDIDGRVNVIIPAAEPDQIYIGGKFNTINGITKRKLAKLDLSDGSVVTAFTAQGNGSVTDLALSNGTLYVTGGFTSFNAQSAIGLGAVDAATGSVDSSFDVSLTTYIGQVSGPIGQRIAVTPDGTTLVVMHRARYVDGQERRGVAMVDISTQPAAVTNWRTRFWDPTSVVSIVDGELSPDGTYLVVVGGWGDSPPWRDTAIAFPVDGNEDTQTLWVTRNHDTTFSVGISDDAVFIGGHFCWTQGVDAPDPWAPLGPTGGSCPGKVRRDDTNVYRDTIAALDPATGRASLKWVPWTDANNGLRFIEVIPRGLLIGGDQTRTTDIRTGRASLFDIADSPPTNLALDGVATQSSTNNDAGADRAIDGNRRTEFFTMTITETNNELQPWWEVDLGATYDVGSVEMWNRLEGFEDRLEDVWVFTSASPFASTDPNVLANDPNVASTFLPGVQGHQTLINVGNQARYARVQLNGTGILALSELRVFEGAAPDTTPPAATVVWPTEGSLVVAPVDLLGDATDNVGVDSVLVEVRNRDTNEWLRDDGTWGAWMELDGVLASPGAPSTSWSYLINNIPDGRYKVFVRSFDAAGNTHTKIERKFDVGAVDLLVPTGDITDPDVDEIVPSPVTLSGWGADNIGVDNVRVELRNRDINQWLGSAGTLGPWEALAATLTSPGAPNTDWSYVTPVLPDGRYKMFITVFDAAGNSTGQIIRNFEIG